jgi:hypothetical protein
MPTALRIPVALFVAFWLFGARAPAQEQPAPQRFVRCSFTPIPKQYRAVSTFDALAVGKDGRVYMGSSNYGSPALLLRYDPKDQSVVAVCDVSSPCGEQSDQPVVPSGKIHSPLCVSSTGKIYFGSHLGDDRCMTGENPHRYGGGHFLCFDPASGRAEDLGVAHWPESVMRVELDEPRGLLYGMTYPGGHLIVKNLATGEISDQGMAAHSGYAMPLLLRDRMVYFLSRPNRVCRYDPDQDVLQEVLQIPLLPSGQGQANDWAQFSSMSCVSADRREVWGTMRGEEGTDRFLYRFRCPHKPGANGTFRYMARVPAEASNVLMAPDSQIYLYRWNLEPRLFCFDRKRKETVDLGPPRDARGRIAVIVWTGTFARDGTLYLGGVLDVPEERFTGSGYGYGALGFFQISSQDLAAAVKEVRQ